ncbi:putative HIT-like domain-containing protein [Plasmopara halstedii]
MSGSKTTGTANHRKERRVHRHLRVCLPYCYTSGYEVDAAEELRGSEAATIEMLPRTIEHTRNHTASYPACPDAGDMYPVSTKTSWSLRKRRQHNSSSCSIQSRAFSSSTSSSSTPSTYSICHKGVTYGQDGALVHCRFCKILQSGDEPFLYEDEDIVVFRPLAPVVESHVLVVPRRHIRNVNALTPDDAMLLIRMREVAASVLRDSPRYAVMRASSAALCSDKDDTESDFKYAFHSPPFNSIDHVHMHAFHTRDSGFGRFNSIKYRTETWWCRSFDEVMTRLGKRSITRGLVPSAYHRTRKLDLP